MKRHLQRFRDTNGYTETHPSNSPVWDLPNTQKILFPKSDDSIYLSPQNLNLSALRQQTVYHISQLKLFLNWSTAQHASTVPEESLETLDTSTVSENSVAVDTSAVSENWEDLAAMRKLEKFRSSLELGNKLGNKPSPHFKLLQRICQSLQQGLKEGWAQMEKTMSLPFKDLFTARPLKVSDLLSDMKATEAEYFNGRHQTLRLLANATAASLEVAPATSYHFMMSTLLAKIEQGTFGDWNRHFSIFEILITRSRVGACKPVALDKHLDSGNPIIFSFNLSGS